MRLFPIPFLLAGFLCPTLLLGDPEAQNENGEPVRVEYEWDRDQKRQAAELVEAFFEAETDEARTEALAAIRALPPIPDRELQRMERAVLDAAGMGGGRRTAPRRRGRGRDDAGAGRIEANGQVQSFESTSGTGRFILNGNPSDGCRLVVGLHGGGAGAGSGGHAASLWSMAVGQDTLGLFPTVIQSENVAWNKEREERYVIELLDRVMEQYSIDTNQVYLVGVSMGGYGAWSVGARHADRFAGIVTQAGGVELGRGVLINLKHVPIHIGHGDRDPVVPLNRSQVPEAVDRLKEWGYSHVYRVLNAPHQLPRSLRQEGWDWVTAQGPRNPYPDYVIWEPSRTWKKRFYWLASDEPTRFTRIVGRVEEENTLSIETGRGAASLSLYVNPERLDVSAPVRVTVDGREVFHDFVYPTLAALVESCLRHDRAMVWAYRIDL